MQKIIDILYKPPTFDKFNENRDDFTAPHLNGIFVNFNTPSTNFALGLKCLALSMPVTNFIMSLVLFDDPIGAFCYLTNWSVLFVMAQVTLSIRN